MTEKDLYVLLEQIRSIILNKPADKEQEEKTQVALELLGDFSKAFHEMVVRLEKREKELKDEAEKNKRFNTLLVSIMNSLKEWVVVTEEETGEVLFTNELAKKRFFDFQKGQYACGGECPLMSRLKSYAGLEHELRYEFKCFRNRIFQAKSYSLLWEDKKAVVHLITDITYQRENEAFLEVMAYKDELTGLDNRRSCLRTIDAYIQKEIPFTLCMIDLDGLKSINDRFGHLSGDEYIKLASEALKETAGDTDFTCRFGGDEFVVLFPDCDEQTAKRKLAMIDRKISGSKKGYPMSVSYGTVYVVKGTHMSPKAALDMADEEMYRFKRHRKEKKNPEAGNRI
ncbi:GGDEF domain-containing protein [Clostridium sp. Marseille-P2415]|uniref:GGDEF domain-containing protein n=1 Tax=Clostridium sp. Marseille-P2415 TaxID=1805471 RepID=UPI000988458D|nr:GGDEF domain-containing protein [Clostridium sp. Marseille-P2415]